MRRRLGVRLNAQFVASPASCSVNGDGMLVAVCVKLIVAECEPTLEVGSKYTLNVALSPAAMVDPSRQLAKMSPNHLFHRFIG